MEFNLEHFDKHGIKDKLAKQLACSEDLTYCEGIDETAQGWHKAIDDAANQAEEDSDLIEAHASDHNADFFTRYAAKVQELKGTVATANTLAATIKSKCGDLDALRQELEDVCDGLKEEFAETDGIWSRRLKNKALPRSSRMPTSSSRSESRSLRRRSTSLPSAPARIQA